MEHVSRTFYWHKNILFVLNTIAVLSGKSENTLSIGYNYVPKIHRHKLIYCVIYKVTTNGISLKKE